MLKTLVFEHLSETIISYVVRQLSHTLVEIWRSNVSVQIQNCIGTGLAFLREKLNLHVLTDLLDKPQRFGNFLMMILNI